MSISMFLYLAVAASAPIAALVAFHNATVSVTPTIMLIGLAAIATQIVLDRRKRNA